MDPSLRQGSVERCAVLDKKTHSWPGWRLQAWLQGWPNKRRPRVVIALGNLVADLRYWTWRLGGRD